MARPATLITGASSGLGAEFARACAARGDELILIARRRDRLDALAAQIGPRVHVIVADLADQSVRAGLPAQVEALGLEVDTLINNAGFGLVGKFAGLPLDRQQSILVVNIVALTELTGLFVRAMVARRRGSVLNVASTAAFQPGPGFAVYFASKAYVLSLSEALHQELKRDGIKVSALCPGPTATEFGEVAGITSDRFNLFSADAKSVVRAGLKGLEGNKAIVVPGLTNKISAQASRLVPRAAMRRIVAAIKL